MAKFYIGLDPSFTRTGISIYNVDEKSLQVCRVENKDLPAKKSFDNMFHLVNLTIRNILSRLPSPDGNELIILSEVPPPSGQFSSGLYALDTALLREISLIYKSTIYIVPPTYIGSVHGTRKYNKSTSTILGNKLLSLFSNVVMDKKNICHDESESLIFLIRLLVREGKVPKSKVPRTMCTVKEKLLK